VTTLLAPAPPPVAAPEPIRSFARSVAHQREAHRLIPGGCHTYAKGDDQMPEEAPVVAARGRGCRVGDLDGNAYVEYGMGLRAVTLGHAEPRVTAAAARALGDGVNFSRPAAIEREAAEAFLALVPGADMVKFCKDGSDATTAAVRLARAATGRDGFPYGDAAALERVFALHPGEIAAVVLEPARGAEDAGPYLREVQRLCQAHGAVLVFDEMITGFRWHAGGAQTLYGVTPDLSCFGKALANGFSVSALGGRRDLMERGGLHTEHPRVFLLSSTHGAEPHALAAALATMRIYREEGVVELLHRQGRRLREGIEAEAEALELGGYFEVTGRDCNLVYVTRDAEGRPSQPFRTLFLQELVRRGVLAPSFVVSAAHGDAIIDRTVEIVADALRVYRQALDGGVERVLAGRSVRPVFRRHS
jgi:glutamate-1-semialdehyde 2,1-aminomutase